ncbi:M56 family metallopeptidase [Desulfosporosinus sp. FKA]|uniref:M56 family metallopeptidase n=1 Tax=Desulfosporosinus sp. FKA TaxID=1969834 RepID=UPI000B4A19E9|nr:M56 family metallopeptidase [Desulfosporosinus sp. FKA]
MSFLLPAFKGMLFSSVLASILVIIIILFKLLFGNKLNVKWHYYVWFLVLIRLLLPYAPECSFSAYNLLRLFSDASHEGIIAQPINHIEDTVLLQNNYVNQPDLHKSISGNNLGGSSNLPNNNSNLDIYLCTVWLLGMAIFGFYTLMKERRFIRQLKNYKRCSDETILALLAACQNSIGFSGSIVVLQTDNYKTPSVSGLIRPKLLLPVGIETKLTNDELRYIILHELAHLKRKDILINCVIGIMQIIHWFNPVLRYAFYCWREDSELASDAYVLSRIGDNHANEYGWLIIKLLEDCSLKNSYGVIGMIGDKFHLKRRMKMISLFNKHSYRWSGLSIALIIILGAVLLTNAQTSANPTSSSQGAIVWSSNFQQDVDKDIADSFHLSLADLHKVDEMSLNDQQEDPYASTMLKVLFQAHKNLRYGSTRPCIYLKRDGKSGYIFTKNADGTNYLYTIAYNQGWAIVKTETRQGKAIASKITKGSGKTYSSLSEVQIQNYLQENSISPLAVQNIGKYTVVLYRIEREKLSDQEKTNVPESVRQLRKTIILSADQNGDILNTGGGSGDDNSAIVPVSMGFQSGESEQGYIGFSEVIINDLDMLTNAYSLKCCYDNNQTTTTFVDHHKAFIIPFPQEKVELINVIVSDKSGRVLFDHNEWPKNSSRI